MSCLENIKYLAATPILICGHRPHVCGRMWYYNTCSEDHIEDMMIHSCHALKFYLKMALEFQLQPVSFLHGQKSACMKTQA